MTGNIIGEEVDEFVGKQIKARQSIAGKGYDSSDPRTQGSQIYQNGRNAWVKLASGVGIIGDGIITTQDEDGYNIVDSKKIESGEQRLIDLGLGANYSGIELAKEAVLFNGLSKLNPSTLKMKDGEYEIDETTQSPIVDQPGSYQFRQGVSKKKGFWNSGKAYGLGGTEFGLQPMPGIESAEIQCLNRGSIKKATVTIKAFNKFQLDVIELLYLRLGYIMMLEWGWDKYYEDKNTLKKTMNTVIEDYWFDQGECTSLLKLYNFVNIYKEKYKANYDGFVGRVTNYQWSFNPDGSYDVVLEMYSVGDVIESLKANVPVGDKTGAKFVATDLSSGEGETSQQVYNRLLSENKINKFRDNEICFWLWNTVRTESFINYENKNLYRIPIYSTTGPTRPNTTTNPYPNLFAAAQKRTNQCPIKYRNFIRLGYFLDELQERVIPYVAPCEKVSDPILRIDTDEETNLISLQDDQFSLDPRVCIHDMTNCFPEDYYWHAKQDPGRGLFIKSEFSVEGGSDAERTDENFQGADSGAIYPLEKFVIQLKANRRNHVVYGRLMNLYINYECLYQIFENNIDRNTGAISLFTFLTELCNEINGAFANTVQLEPIIDDGEIIKLVDLNPLVREKPPLEKKNYINIYGYNQDDNTSNFVRDLSLNTFIDSKLSSTLAIGAVREGNIPKNYEGAGLQYWNRGLKNRYLNDIIINEKPYEISTSKNIKEYKKRLATHWKDYSSLGTTIVNAVTNYNVISGVVTGILYNPIRKTVYYNGKWYWNVYAYEFVEQAFSDDTVNHNNQVTRNLRQKSIIQPSLDWRTYVAYSIGGQTSKGYENNLSSAVKNKMISYIDSMYFACDPGYINLGKSLWKQVLSKRASAGAKLGYPPLSYNGFIPISFDLTLEGIGGIKIYNRLNLSQDFLPYQYKQGKFEYIIKQVNHNISDNDWTTKINSFSYPDLDLKYFKRYKDGDGIPTDNQLEEVENQPDDPLELLKDLIAKGESFGGDYTISNFLFKNNPNDQNNNFAVRTDLDVTKLTIQEILDRGQIRSDVTQNQLEVERSGAIWATGKYQFIPDTLKLAVRNTDGVELSDRYTPEVQEKLFEYLIFSKRERVGKYIKNTNIGSGVAASKLNLEIAITSLAKEFASIPTIKKSGGAEVGYVANGIGNISYYGGNDTAHHTIKDVVIALIKTRIYYSNQVPEYIPDYF